MKFIKWVLFVIAFLIFIIFVRDYAAIAISWLNYKAFPITSFWGFIMFMAYWATAGIIITLFLWIGGLITLICPNQKQGTIILLCVYYINCAISYFLFTQNNQKIWQHVLIDLCALSLINLIFKIKRI